MDAHKFVFICGLHRSGTWLQTHSLETHPDISRLGVTTASGGASKVKGHEGQFLQTVYPVDQYYGGVGRLGFHPEIHLTEDSDLVSEANRKKLFAEWSRYWDPSKPYLLEKTPSNLMRTRFLQAMFPNSYFILVMRHPVAVALAQQKWSGTSVSSLIEHWLLCYETLYEDAQKLDQCIHLRYEDFIQDPQNIVDKVYSFLGLESQHLTQAVRKDGNDRYFRIWSRALTTNDSVENLTLGRRLRNRLMPLLLDRGHPLTILANEAQMTAIRYELRIRQFGYSLVDLGSQFDVA